MALVHPIFMLLVRRPELVVDHLSGYAALAQQEASSFGMELARCAIAGVAAAVCFIVFLVLAGVGVMLGVMQGEFHWVLVATPGVSLALGIVAFGLARKSIPSQVFMELRSQFDADAQALRMAGASS